MHGNLAVYPVFGEGSPMLEFLTLGEALAAGGFKIGEVGGGQVPELLVSNATGRGADRRQAEPHPQRLDPGGGRKRHPHPGELRGAGPLGPGRGDHAERWGRRAGLWTLPDGWAVATRALDERGLQSIKEP